MKKGALILLVLSLLCGQVMEVMAKTMMRVNALGASPKGQYVAFEEFGFLSDSKMPFARIKVMNVWKNKYVGKEINVVSDKKNQMELEQVRAQAKKLATERLKKFNIST